MARKTRLDAELVRRGLARSRQHAVDLVTQGKVRVGGLPADKVTTAVDAAMSVQVVTGDAPDVVSRGAHKLEGALARWPDLSVTGARCLDAGASTGGFTQVLLRHGAGEVIAVDVGYGQLAWSLRSDPRVRVLDRTNARDLTSELVGAPVDLVVADLSFISLTLVIAPLVACAGAQAEMLLMVKPQFEAGREAVGSGGVVRDPEVRRDAVAKVAAAAHDLGWGTVGVVASPLPGPSGNVEYFLRLRRAAGALDLDALGDAISAGPQ